MQNFYQGGKRLILNSKSRVSSLPLSLGKHPFPTLTNPLSNSQSPPLPQESLNSFSSFQNKMLLPSSNFENQLKNIPSPRFASVKKERVIEEINFEGGGGKGIAYIGAIKVLEEKNLLKNVKIFSGVSAGSIAALFCALGTRSNDLQKILSGLPDILNDMPHYETQMNKALETYSTEEYIDEIGGNGIGVGLSATSAVATSLVEQKAISSGDKLISFLESQCEAQLLKLAESHPGIIGMFKDLRNPTFQELENAAKEFRGSGLAKLSVGVTENATFKNLKSKLSSDESIIKAVYQSASIPFVFRSLGNRVDGGVTRNAGAVSGETPPEKTLIFIFDREPGNSLTHSVVDLALRPILGTKVHQNNRANLARMQNNALGKVIRVPFGGLSTLDMNPSSTVIDNAIQGAHFSVKNQLEENE